MSQVSTVSLGSVWTSGRHTVTTLRFFGCQMDQGNEAHLQISCSKAPVSRTSNKCVVLRWCSSSMGGDVFDCHFKFSMRANVIDCMYL